VDNNDFDDLIAEGLRSGVPQRLLLVLLRVEFSEEDKPSESGGTLTPVLVNDLELTPEISCTTLMEEADSVGLSWNMMMVSTLSSTSGALPGSEEAKPHLEKMAGDVLQGRDLAAYAIFDRDGTRLEVNPSARG
jgi:hypothetical protein